MDKAVSETTRPIHDITDPNLPAVVASLEMLTVNTNISSSPGKRRILRKRINKVLPTEPLNRRCSLRPKKRTHSEMQAEVDVQDYYLDKTIKKITNNLETIYEEKDDFCENSETSHKFMSAKRYKRMIQFQEQPSDSKIKKRRAKIKKVFGSKVNFKRKRASMNVLLEKLNGIRADSPRNIDNEVK